MKIKMLLVVALFILSSTISFAAGNAGLVPFEGSLVNSGTFKVYLSGQSGPTASVRQILMQFHTNGISDPSAQFVYFSLMEDNAIGTQNVANCQRWYSYVWGKEAHFRATGTSDSLPFFYLELDLTNPLQSQQVYDTKGNQHSVYLGSQVQCKAAQDWYTPAVSK